MSRQQLSFDCEGARLVGTLDPANGSTGLVIITGGNETRAGAFSGQARLAARIAQARYPVFRFDRRGVGDSEGANTGFRHSQADMAAALACFREHCPQLTRVVAFGNCDAASALMLASDAGFAGLILSNPWTYDDHGDESAQATPPPAAIRSRYLEKLRNPREVWRLLTGGVDLGKLLSGLRSTFSKPVSTRLTAEMADSLKHFHGAVRLLIAERDRTGQAFLASWDKGDPRISVCKGADHAYSGTVSEQWLLDQILEALADE